MDKKNNRPRRDMFRTRTRHVPSTDATRSGHKRNTLRPQAQNVPWNKHTNSLPRPANLRGTGTTAFQQQANEMTAYFFSFSRSRISVSNTSSLLGAGGAAGAAGSAFLRLSLESRRTNRKTEKAMMRKSNVTCRKFP